MAAVVIYFWKDLWRIAGAWLASLVDRDRRSDPDARMGWYLIVATIPIGVFGLVFDDQIESGARNLRLIATTLILLGLVLLVAEKVGTRRKTIDDLDTRDGITIGLAQSMALVPGVSRSGSTITAGLFLGYQRADAARFSFLLSVPAVVASGLYPTEGRGRGRVGLVPTAVAADRVVHRGLRGDRLAAPVALEPQHGGLRDLPGGARDPALRAAGGRRHRRSLTTVTVANAVASTTSARAPRDRRRRPPRPRPPR